VRAVRTDGRVDIRFVHVDFATAHCFWIRGSRGAVSGSSSKTAGPRLINPGMRVWQVHDASALRASLFRARVSALSMWGGATPEREGRLCDCAHARSDREGRCRRRDSRGDVCADETSIRARSLAKRECRST